MKLSTLSLKRCSGTQFDAQLVRVFLEAHRFYIPEEIDRETEEKIININRFKSRLVSPEKIMKVRMTRRILPI